jgi:hypothetical protein
MGSLGLFTLAALKIWTLFLVGGSGPTGIRGGPRGIKPALEHIHKLFNGLEKVRVEAFADFFPRLN